MNSLTFGADGKVYLARRVPAELARTRAIVHRLACGEGLSRREIQRRLFDLHVKRSVGSISQDLSRFECDRCAVAPKPAARPAGPAEAYSWR